MKPTFGLEYIESEFQRIGDGLSEPLTIYLIGCGAMSLRDLKGAPDRGIGSSNLH